MQTSSSFSQLVNFKVPQQITKKYPIFFLRIFHTHNSIGIELLVNEMRNKSFYTITTYIASTAQLPLPIAMIMIY